MNGRYEMTHQEAIAKLVDLEVVKWGECERAAAQRLNERNYPTIGLVLNRLAYYDLDNIDEALAAEAQRVMTVADRRILKKGA
jgi:hypothetical protein